MAANAALLTEVERTVRWMRSRRGPIYRAWDLGWFEPGSWRTLLTALDGTVEPDQLVNFVLEAIDRSAGVAAVELIRRYRALRRAVHHAREAAIRAGIAERKGAGR